VTDKSRNWFPKIVGRKWPVVVLLGLGFVGFWLFIAQDAATLTARTGRLVGDPLFPDYLAELVGAPISRGDTYRVLQNGDEIFPAMLTAIGAARSRIVFESYVYSEGEVERQFTKALAEAAERGVSVRVVLDALGAAPLPSATEKRFKTAGVQVVWFNPVGLFTLEDYNYRTHRKLLIIDGEVAFTGGAGVADHWLGRAQDEDHWRDTQFQITGPAVRSFEACFYQNWLEAGGEGTPEIKLDQSSRTNGARSIVIWSNANEGASNVKLLYLYLIVGAQRTIDIQSPYFILDESVHAALSVARHRGVKIRILTDGDLTDARSVKHASRNGYDTILEAGDRLFEYQPTMMHVKAMIVDDAWSVFGSANFDNRSFELNDEISVAVADKELAATLSQAFERDIAQSKEVRMDEWRGRPLHQKVRERFWGMFGEVF
jgi:cardiolipin synthase